MALKSSESCDEKRSPNEQKALVTISLVREIGLTMIFNVLIGFFTGMYLDRWLNTSFLFIFVGTMLGMVSGFRMVYLLIMKMERRGDKRD